MNAYECLWKCSIQNKYSIARMLVNHEQNAWCLCSANLKAFATSEVLQGKGTIEQNVFFSNFWICSKLFCSTFAIEMIPIHEINIHSRSTSVKISIRHKISTVLNLLSCELLLGISKAFKIVFLFYFQNVTKRLGYEQDLPLPYQHSDWSVQYLWWIAFWGTSWWVISNEIVYEDISLKPHIT